MIQQIKQKKSRTLVLCQKKYITDQKNLAMIQPMWYNLVKSKDM